MSSMKNGKFFIKGKAARSHNFSEQAAVERGLFDDGDFSGVEKSPLNGNRIKIYASRRICRFPNSPLLEFLRPYQTPGYIKDTELCRGGLIRPFKGDGGLSWVGVYQ